MASVVDTYITQLVQNGSEVSPTNPLPTNARESWRVQLIADETLNDSDKTLVVPGATEWQVLWIWVENTTSGDAGNRQLEVQLLDAADDVIGSVRAGLTQAASLTYNYLFGVGAPDGLSLRDDNLVNVALPVLFLSAGQKIRVFDNNAVAAAADDMVVQMQVASRSVA